MMQVRILSIVLLGALLFAGCAPSLPTHPEQLAYPALDFQPPQVEKLVLDNGIRLYLKQDKELPLVQVTAMIGSGAMTTPKEKAGFGGLFGSTWRSGGAEDWSPEELDERVDRIAANLGASMSAYVTQLNLSIRSADIEEGLCILGSMLLLPHFNEDKLDLARLKAKEAVRRQNDNPGSIARRLLGAALYPDHYIGYSPTLESLDQISRDDLTAFHQQYFAPNNLWLAISGDFDREELLDILDDNFGQWESKEVAPQPLAPVEPTPTGGIQVVNKDLPQTTILIGDLGLTKDHPDQYAVRVMNYILGGGGFNSRLMREIRSNQGLAYSVYSYFQVGRRLPGQFVAGTETKSATVGRSVSLMRDIMTQIQEDPVSEEELTLAKESQINSFVFGFENTHSVVSQQMRLDFYDYPPDYLANYRDRIAAVSIEDVQRVAREFLRLDRQKIVLVGESDVFLDDLEALKLPVEMVELDE
ncbi:MAG: insulinase family protein [Desulfuromonadales bacterium]|nr:insulinase family protein [Desulfuromonadales bacterium]